MRPDGRWHHGLYRLMGKHQTLTIAASTVVGALLGVVINLLTGSWNWWLFIAFVTLVSVAAAINVVLTRISQPLISRWPAATGVFDTRVPVFNGMVLGRDGLISAVVAALSAGAGGRIRVVHGLIGVGTSTLASRVGRQIEDNDVTVRWIDGSQPTTFLGCMEEVSEEFRHPNEPSYIDPMNTFWWRLEHYPRRWLLIIDGLDNFDNLEKSARSNELYKWLRLPPQNGAILIASADGRRSNLPSDCVDWTPVGGLNPVDGGILLASLAPGRGAVSEAEELSVRLGGHPLALKLAGRCLANVHARDDGAPRTFKEFGDAVGRQPWWKVVKSSPLAATWMRALSLLKSRSPSAPRFLGLLASISTEPIPRVMLETGLKRALGQFGDLYLWDKCYRLLQISA